RSGTVAGGVPASRARAAVPATNGAAIDVPDWMRCPPPGQVERIMSPGAATSTQSPTEENPARRSPGVVAATASTPGDAAGHRRGDPRSASLPAAATTTTPEVVA